MLYGYGDDKNPYTETVDFLEDLVMEFISEMTRKGLEVGRQGRISVEDIIFLIRKDAKARPPLCYLLRLESVTDRAKHIPKTSDARHIPFLIACC